MTKLRTPLSIENALYKVLGRIGIEAACDSTGRKAAYLRNLSDPDKREQLTVADAIKLDLAHRQSGAGGAPIYETIGLLLQATDAELFSDSRAIGRVAMEVIKEGGEAHVALVNASFPGASPQDFTETLRELEENAAALSKAIALIRCISAAGIVGQQSP
ncbi:hypothetical protein [Sphingomonas sp. TREG-RG-20F-R18-01]|uniref:hypothetical protein n=1 Tax=Sphingomonas sp. TREG-RG-20F-R18-01 TaxID=2914982 RepID=UPI001F5734AF|nr:hypothetical protein [Sphingomonas sp. TREG-RG-20F-R18-01]